MMKNFYQRFLTLFVIIITLGIGQAWCSDASSANFYYDNSSSSWSDVQIMIGHNTWSSIATMTKLTNTNQLYYRRSFSWGGYSEFYFVTGCSSWGDEGNSPTHRVNYCTNSSKLTTNVSNHTYLFVSSGGSAGQTVTATDCGTDYDKLNYTYTVEQKLSNNGGSSYSASTANLATVKVSSYKLNSATAVSATANDGTISAGNSNANCKAVRTATVTYSVANVAAGYHFVGWYDGNTQKSTNATYNDLWAISNTTITARFTQNYTVGATLYLLPNSDWKKDGARFAAYFYGAEGEQWVDCSQVGTSDYYSVTVPSGNWGYVIFCRMDGSTSVNNWNNKWNQTDDLMYDASHNGVEITGWDNSQSRITVFDGLSVTRNIDAAANAPTITNSQTAVKSGSSISIVAQNENTGYDWVNWTSSNGSFGTATNKSTTFTPTASNAVATANYSEKTYNLTFTLDGQGSIAVGGSTVSSGSTVSVNYHTTKTLVATPAAGYYFKGWKLSGSNIDAVTIGDASNASTTIKATNTGATITAEFSPIWTISGDMDGWATETHLITNITASNGTMTSGYVDITLDANSDYEFKVVNRASSPAKWWGSSNDYTITYANKATAKGLEEENGSQNVKIRTAAGGSYRFTWNVSNGEITVTYPTSYKIEISHGYWKANNQMSAYTNTSQALGGTVSAASGSITGALSVNSNDGTQYVQSGENVTFTHSAPATGWRWAQWGKSFVNSSHVIDLDAPYTVNDAAGTVTLTNVTANKHVYGFFRENVTTVTVNTDNSSRGTLEINNSSQSWGATTPVGITTEAGLKAIGANGYMFSGWTLGGGTQLASGNLSTDQYIRVKGNGTNGSTGTATASFNNYGFVVRGSTYDDDNVTDGLGGWGATTTYLVPGTPTAGKGTYTATLNRGTKYKIKVYGLEGSGYWWGSPTTDEWENGDTKTLAGGDYDIVFTAGANGTYTFVFDFSTHELTINYPTAYYVTYHGNGSTSGSVPTDNTPYASGETVYVKGNTGSLIKANYTLSGWNTTEHITGTNYSSAGGSSFTISDNTDLYAKWTQTVTLDRNSAISGSTTVTMTYNSNTLTGYTEPTKLGYNFGGYWTNETDNNGNGTLVIDTDGNLQANVDGYTGDNGVWIRTTATTLYAEWLPIFHHITFQHNGHGTIAVNGTIIPSGGTAMVYHLIERSLVATPNTGYHFTGWTVTGEDAAHVKIADTSIASTTIKTTGGNATVTAGFEPDVYDITYKDQGNVAFSGVHGAGYPTSHTYGTATALVSPTKVGYTFEGWFTNSACTGTAATSLGATAYTDNITLYAKWTANTYTITLNDEGGSGGSGSKTVTYNASTNLTTNVSVPTKAGYVFLGYYTGENDGIQFIDANGAWQNSISGYIDNSSGNPIWIYTNNLTLHAHYVVRYGLYGSLDSNDQSLEGMPGWAAYGHNSADFTYNAGSSNYTIVINLTKPNDTYKFRIVDRSDNFSWGLESSEIIPENTATTLNSGIADALLASAGTGSYTLTVVEADSPTHPRVTITNAPSYRLNLGWTIGGSVTATSTEGGNTYPITNGQYLGAGASITYTATTTTPGYFFAGWFSSSDYSGAPFTTEASWTNSNVTETQNVYAQWKPLTITFITNGNWNDGTNWSTGYVPLAINDVVINAQCTVNSTGLECHNMNFGENGSLTITTAGMLKVNGTLTNTAASKLTVNIPGGIAIGDGMGSVRATVNFQCSAGQATIGGASHYRWQAIGWPFTALNDVHDPFGQSWVMEYFGNNVWDYVRNGFGLTPFQGYLLTPKAPQNSRSYTWTGTLNGDASKALSLDYYGNASDHWNFVANSWLAPIDVATLTSDYFTKADATVYLLNTGSRYDSSDTEYVPGTTDYGDTNYDDAGQYTVVNSTLASTRPVLIAPGQGFFVAANNSSGGTLNLNYADHVFATAESTTRGSNVMRAPRREQQAPDFTHMKITVRGERFGDGMYIFEGDRFTGEYDNGADGQKAMGMFETSPQIMAQADYGDMSLYATPDVDGTLIGFRAGTADTQYTLRFSGNMGQMYLTDLVTNTETLVGDGSEYTFTAENTDEVMTRFRLNRSTQHGGTTTDIEDGTAGGVKVLVRDGEVELVWNNEQGAKNKDIRLYDATGKLLYEEQGTRNKEQGASGVTLRFTLPQQGVYLLRIGTTTRKIVY